MAGLAPLSGGVRAKIVPLANLDEQFHVNDIEPAPEFEPYLLKATNLLEAKAGVQPNTGFICVINGGDDGVQTSLASASDQRGHQFLANAAPALIRSDI